jgi:hypothetical protein
MKKFAQKIKSLIWRRKPTPWYKKIFKKTASLIDMKRRNKILTFFVLLFAAAYLCLPSMEGIVKKFVHQYGSELTGTNVRIRRFHLKPASGEGGVRGFSIANPKGYQSKNLLTLDKLNVTVEIASLTKDVIVIDRILLDQPVITYEMLSLTQNNISDVLDHIQRQTASAASDKDESDSSSKKIIIKDLTVQNGKIEVVAGVGSLKKPISLPLPVISLKNIGQEEKGSDITETLSLVLKKIFDTTVQTVGSSGLKELGTQTTETLKEAGQAAVDAGKGTLNTLTGFLK